MQIIVLYYTALQIESLYCPTLSCIAMCCTALHYITRYRTASHYITQYRTALHSIALHIPLPKVGGSKFVKMLILPSMAHGLQHTPYKTRTELLCITPQYMLVLCSIQQYTIQKCDTILHIIHPGPFDPYIYILQRREILL